MPSEKEIIIIQKATVYDLLDIIEKDKEKQSYTPEEIRSLLKAYITGVAQ